MKYLIIDVFSVRKALGLPSKKPKIASGGSGQIPNFFVILEESYNLFTHKRFGRMTGNWVTNWQPYLFLRFAVSCLT